MDVRDQNPWMAISSQASSPGFGQYLFTMAQYFLMGYGLYYAVKNVSGFFGKMFSPKVVVQKEVIEVEPEEPVVVQQQPVSNPRRRRRRVRYV